MNTQQSVKLNPGQVIGCYLHDQILDDIHTVNIDEWRVDFKLNDQEIIKKFQSLENLKEYLYKEYGLIVTTGATSEITVPRTIIFNNYANPENQKKGVEILKEFEIEKKKDNYGVITYWLKNREDMPKVINILKNEGVYFIANSTYIEIIG